MASGRSRIESVELLPVQENIMFAHGLSKGSGWVSIGLKDPLDFGLAFDVYGGKHMGVLVTQSTNHTKKHSTPREDLEKSLRKEAKIVAEAMDALAGVKRPAPVKGETTKT